MNEHVQAVVLLVETKIAALRDLKERLLAWDGTQPAEAGTPNNGVQTGGRGGAGVKRKAESGKAKTKPKDDFHPMSEALIRAGRTLREPMSAGSLSEASGCTMKQASNAFVRWSYKGWISRSGHGEYTRAKQFGGGNEASRAGHKLLEEIHQEIDSQKPHDD